MYCRKCGKQIDDEAVVCPHCGVLAVRRGAGFYGQPAQPVQPVQYYNAPVQQPVQIIQQPVQAAAEQKSKNAMGVAGFVVGLISLIFGMYFCITAVAAFIISVFAVMDRKKYERCNGLAIAGLVISSVALALWFGLWAAFFITLIIA